MTGFPKATPFTVLQSPQVVIQVLDVNDCRPQFSKPQFSTSVYENEPAGTSVITMLATDQDEGSNGQLTYSLEGPGMGIWAFLAGREGQTAMSTALGLEEEEQTMSQPSHSFALSHCQRLSSWTWTRAW